MKTSTTAPVHTPPREASRDTSRQEGKDAVRHSETLPVMSEGSAPRLPHEHDESSSSQASAPREIMKQASKDVANGIQDGSLGPPMDETYKREFRGKDQPGSDQGTRPARKA